MSGEIVISYELKDAAPAFILFMSIKTGWVFAHRNKRHHILGQTKRFLRGCENFLPALA